MATEDNQNSKSMNSLESNASNIIDKDTDRKSQDSQDIKSEISTHRNTLQHKSKHFNFNLCLLNYFPLF